MKFAITLFVVCVAAHVTLAIPQFSISDSNVPEIRYELNAVEALTQAYVLYPDNPKRRVEAFSDLYGDIYPIPNGWNVVSACDTFYTSKERLYVDIKCDDAAANVTEIVKVFS